jgi:hypothetical protein
LDCRIPKRSYASNPAFCPPYPKVDETGCGVIEGGVWIRLDLEVPNQPEALALENPDMPIEAGHIKFVEVAAQEQRVLRVLESRETP